MHQASQCKSLIKANANVSVGYPTMHKALVFLYVYNSTLWLGPTTSRSWAKKKRGKLPSCSCS